MLIPDGKIMMKFEGTIESPMSFHDTVKAVELIIACMLMSVGLVGASSLMVSFGNSSDTWVCRIAERLGGAVLAPGVMTELYSGSRVLVLISDTLFYAVIFFLISYCWMERRKKIVKNGPPRKQ